MSSVKKKINSAKSYPNIIIDISKALDKEKINHKSSQSEIAVKDGKKKEIVNIITSLMNKDDFHILIDVVEAKKTVYIRKKIA